MTPIILDNYMCTFSSHMYSKLKIILYDNITTVIPSMLFYVVRSYSTLILVLI